MEIGRRDGLEWLGGIVSSLFCTLTAAMGFL